MPNFIKRNRAKCFAGKQDLVTLQGLVCTSYRTVSSIKKLKQILVLPGGPWPPFFLRFTALFVLDLWVSYLHCHKLKS